MKGVKIRRIMWTESGAVLSDIVVCSNIASSCIGLTVSFQRIVKDLEGL